MTNSSKALSTETLPVLTANLCQHVMVCTGKACTNNNSEAVLDAFRSELKEKGLLFGKRGSWDGTILVTKTGCTGLCDIGPAVMVYPEGVWYHHVKAKIVPKLVQSHFIEQQPLEEQIARRLPSSLGFASNEPGH